MALAYIAAGKLRVKRGDEPAVAIESKFADSIRQRAASLHRRHGWKGQGRGARFLSGAMLWGANDPDPLEMRISITGISAGASAGQLYYTLETPEISGVFLVRDGGADELRLYHTADFRLSEVAAHPQAGRLVFVLRNKGGGSSLAMMSADGTEFVEVTQGDAIDAAPQWVPGTPSTIVFQSAGVARDQSGRYHGRGPFSVQKLDIASGEMTCLAEAGEFDFVGPRVTADGTVYCIRRPYQPPHPKVNPFKLLLDLLLFPFRLVYAIFQYFNFFTMKYTGNPLVTAGGARQQNPDLGKMMIWDNMVNADAASKSEPDAEAPDLVPKTWELLRFAPGQSGSPEVLARGVLSFDVATDGAVLYSNGTAVFRLDPTGRSERLVKEPMIQSVIAARW
jgi:hypothetical protein